MRCCLSGLKSMHRLATILGGWNPAAEGVIFVEQQPATITVE
jgi:cobaltochelatase CobN